MSDSSNHLRGGGILARTNDKQLHIFIVPELQIGKTVIMAFENYETLFLYGTL